MNSDLKKFGAWLANIRLKSGYGSQRQLCLVSDVSPSTLSRIEAGYQKPGPDILKKIAPYLKGVTYEDLMTAAGYLDFDISSEEAEIARINKELENRKELQLLFKKARQLSPEKITHLIKYIELLKEE